MTIAVVLLLGLAIYVGLRWRLQSLPAYFTAVVGTLMIWGSAVALRQTYAVMLPLVCGTLASLLLALVGLRAAKRAGADPDGSPEVWIAGVCLAVAPIVLAIVASLQ